MKTNSQRGVALILTLLLLSVITFLTVAFLALSRRERVAVKVTLDQTRARQATETATERAKAQLIAQMLATTNKWNYSLTVTTNFINAAGFQPGSSSLLNVNYDYRTNGTPLNDGDLRTNIANLYYDPRPPVVIPITNFATKALDSRYYLDLNRNYRFDTNGWLPVIGPNPAAPFLNTNGNWTNVIVAEATVSNRCVGDPEWIGMLDKLGEPHAAKNRFIARYAFLTVPVGQTLDLNAIYNQANNTLNPPDPSADGFMRNQGLGSWELNLAAALEDSNTNYWDRGTSAMDARNLLSYRYNRDYNNLLSADDYYAGRAASFANDFIDEYANGPLLSGSVMTNDNDNPSLPWSGADNPNAFFTTQDFFDTSKVGTSGFDKKLLLAGTTNASNDRYLFYRLLSMLGTDSGAEPPDLSTGLPSDQAPPKVNLNYDNRPGVPPLTDWAPEAFFTNAADRLLRDPALHPYAFARLSITNIPVWPPYTNFYSPAIHRLLQVAANLYDATTANTWPSVFRPIFRRDDNNVFIVNYRELPNADLLAPGAGTMLDPNTSDFQNIPVLGTPEQGVLAEPMLVGVPLVIGAKKGLPNFNEFSMQSVIQIQRKLQFTKDKDGVLVSTNQMYYIGVSNMCGVEAWNSYVTNYPGGLKMSVSVDLTTVLSNQVSVVASNRTFFARSYPPLVAVGWPTPSPLDPATYRYLATSQAGFFVPLKTNLLFLANSQYRGANPPSLANQNSPWPIFPTGFPVPNLHLLLTARVNFSLVDANNRIVDYVNLATLTNSIDLTRELMVNSSSDVMTGVWLTNRPNRSVSDLDPTMGVINQILICLGNTAVSTTEWNSYSQQAVSGQDKAKAIEAFRIWMGLTDPTNQPNNPSLTMQAPFNPARKLSVVTKWEVNDPLVHYTAGDLGQTNLVKVVSPPNSTNYGILPGLGWMNSRTRPWGGNPNEVTSVAAGNIPPREDRHAYNLQIKDPQVVRSDDWEFPTNKFGNLGAIGRVHRGTPWQTIYMKSPDVAEPLWQTWSGNWDARDAAGTRPVSDRFLFEHFTVSLGPNATRGQLSINNSELAAWSAVLAGVQDLRSTATDLDLSNPRQRPRLDSAPILPAGAGGWNSPLGVVVAAINRTRALFPAQTFTNLGNLLAVPELTVISPFLTPNLTNNLSDIQRQRGLTDAAYERIPQQIMSLLRGDDDPRFVIYAFGQSLQPAPGSILTDDPYLLLCTNYIITAESATRTVVRIVGAPKPGDLSTNVQPRAVIESFNYLPPD
jgi:hypothetical protein